MDDDSCQIKPYHISALKVSIKTYYSKHFCIVCAIICDAIAFNAKLGFKNIAIKHLEQK